MPILPLPQNNKHEEEFYLILYMEDLTCLCYTQILYDLEHLSITWDCKFQLCLALLNWEIPEKYQIKHLLEVYKKLIWNSHHLNNESEYVQLKVKLLSSY